VTKRTALNIRLADDSPFFKKRLDCSEGLSNDKAHSLHYIIPWTRKNYPEVANFFLKLYSESEDRVLDPFAGYSALPLEAVLLGRNVLASDIDPLGLKVTSAKLFPADIAEVTLALQFINLKRPVELGAYLQYFAPFYDITTFRELVNLKRHIKDYEGDRVVDFISVIALGLMHGQGAGFFSVYTSSQYALSPNEQLILNAKRSQEPDYRSVIPRIIRKTAMALRDGISSSMRRLNNVSLCDPRNLSHISTDSIDFVFTTIPLPNPPLSKSHNWLRYWFLNQNVIDNQCEYETISQWLDYMNEVLLELARVVRGGRRTVFHISTNNIKNISENIDNMLINMISQQLSHYWETEGMYEINYKQQALHNCLRPLEHSKLFTNNEVALVLRRR